MNEEYVSAILASPPEDIYLLLTSGNSIRFGVYFDKATKKSLVRCDVCEKFLVLGAARSTSKLKNHQAGKVCEKRAERLRRAREVEKTKAEAERPLLNYFCPIWTGTPGFGTDPTSFDGNETEGGASEFAAGTPLIQSPTQTPLEEDHPLDPSLLVHKNMDASGDAYYDFPSDDLRHSSDPKRCSVRGCTQFLADGTNNKMCDICRGRHRIYASTKRAKRKLEKAAVANAVAAHNVGDNVMLVHESDHTLSQSQVPPIVSPWVAQSVQRDTTSLSSPMSSSPASWNQAIDPQLFSADGMVGSSLYLAQKPPQTSSTSELANALTLPTPGTKAQLGTPLQPEDQSMNALEQGLTSDMQLDSPERQATGENGSGGSTRFCSVKGCKAVIPVSYKFKMCPPCRVRYRTYGNTKRVKWKLEREAFDHEMALLRTLEDEKRRAKGLGPLADNPEELRVWELSIIDEQIELPAAVPPPTSALQLPETPNVSVNFSPLITGANTFSTNLQSPMVTAGVYPASVGSIDTPHSISPYPHLNHTIMGAPAAPLPARMCTVSHCHKILPGYYRYKRCEQHRLQNRHHSQLKRVREKEVKSAGPEDGATPLEIDENALSAPNNAERAKNLKLLQHSKTTKKERKSRKDKGTKKVKVRGSEAPEPTVEGSSQAPESDPQPPSTQSSPKPSSSSEPMADNQPKQKGRPKVYSCTKEGCHNLLVLTQRWRTCDDCRMAERKRQFQVRAELKAAESVYWKSISERMSAERKAEGATNTNAAASGGGYTDGQAHDQEADDPARVEIDADADGDSEDTDSEEPVHQPVYEPIVSTADSAQVPPPPTASNETSHGPTTPSGGGFSKFFVQLPSPPPRKATSEELLKLSDALTSRAYQPKTTPSAIGRILAHNPHVSVDDFSDILEVDRSKTLGLAKPTNEAKEGQLSNLTNTEPSDKSFPTATVPTSTPFVYNATGRRPEKATDAPTTPSTSKGKRKLKMSSQSVQSTSAGPSVSFVPPMTCPTNPYSLPYGYRPSYPYYPYYMPPYSMGPYPYPPPPGSDPSNQAYPPSGTTSSAGPPPPTGFYPYPYAPQSYGNNAPPPGYPYLPPRYTTPSYGQTSGQQPHPGPGSSSGAGYSYYPLPPPLSVSAPARPPTTSKPKEPKEADKPAGPAKFSFHHYILGEFGGPQEPRKRLKADPNNSEKFKSHTSVIKMPPMPVGNTALPESTQLEASGPDPAASQSTQPNPSQQYPSEPLTKSGAETPTPTPAEPATRPCATKTCSRSIPAEVHGTICEKCKLRFKKHQIKAKLKYKLEPRKFLMKKASEESTKDGVR